MKQEIINELQNSITPLSIVDLIMKLNITDHHQQQELIADLEELKTSEIILENKEQQFYMLKHNNLFIGKIQVTKKGFGFVKLLNSEGEYYCWGARRAFSSTRIADSTPSGVGRMKVNQRPVVMRKERLK